MSAATTSAWQARLTKAFKAQPKKAVALTGLVLVMAVLWGKMMFSSSGQVSPARAAAGTAVVLPDAISTPISPQGGSAGLQDWLNGRIQPVGRNLFVIKLDYFPQDARQINKTLRDPSGDGFWDQLAKSMTSRADQEKRRKILIENLQLQAARLKLESTMLAQGDPRALVNGNLVREGELVAQTGFRLVKIEARRIIVEREGIKLEIRLSGDGG